jgi:spore coat protein U-like protein
MSSRFRSNVPIGLTAIAGLLLAAGPAAAAESVQGQKLLVQALVGQACTVTSASLSFPPYDGAVAGVEGTGAIQLNCVAPTNVSVKLNGGQNGGNGEGQRTLKNGSSTLTYQLFTDSTRSSPWLTNTTTVSAGTINGTGSVPVYGKIAGSQPIGSAGLYTDEVTITLVF